MSMKTCASCGTRYPKARSSCPECGETGQPAGAKPYRYCQMVEGEWVDLGCQYNDHGAKCQRRGSIAATMNGRGPWYCSDHAWVILYDRKQDRPAGEGFGQARDQLRQVMEMLK